VISTLELFRERHNFGANGVFSVGAVSSFHSLGTLRRIDGVLTIVLVIQVVSGGVLALGGPFSVVGRLALILSLLSMILLRWRRHAGGDGAEQLSVLILLATSLAVLPSPSDSRIQIVAIFIAAQASLAYCTAGIAKLVSQTWRDGQALPAILSTDSYGDPWAAQALLSHPRLSYFLSWSIIVYECSFPLVVFTSGWLLTSLLAFGLFFHIGCAVLMGLNSFLWVFPATYPCIIAVAKLGMSEWVPW
jgi:hypothetical protein